MSNEDILGFSTHKHAKINNQEEEEEKKTHNVSLLGVFGELAQCPCAVESFYAPRFFSLSLLSLSLSLSRCCCLFISSQTSV